MEIMHKPYPIVHKPIYTAPMPGMEQKVVVEDIHIHQPYVPAPVHAVPVPVHAAPAHVHYAPFTSSGIILVLFILLVIITRSAIGFGAPVGIRAKK